MNVTWYKSMSYNDPPVLVDYESSPTTVYIRRKVEKQEVDDPITGNKQVEYVYEEAKLMPFEYTVYASEQAREDNLAIMNALADIYERLTVLESAGDKND